jgi:hypothetical protein
MAALTAAILVLPLLTSSPAVAVSSEEHPAQGTLSASKFVTLYPFILPIVAGELKDKQFTVVLAIELADENGRDEITRLSAKIRNALYPELYRLISFRTREPRYISSATLKRKLTPIVQRIAGTDLVKGLVVKEAYESDMP